MNSTFSPIVDPANAPASGYGSGSSSWLDFANYSSTTWVILILFLALVGINVFVYLAQGTQLAAGVLAPLFRFFGFTLLETSKQVISNTAEGTVAGVTLVSDAAIDTIDHVQQHGGNPVSQPSPQTNQTQKEVGRLKHIQQQQQIEDWQQSSLEKALDDSARQTGASYRPDDCQSTIQTTGKSGWCFIGEEQGIRTCAEIGVNDVCMSGDIFPSQAICMNPKLRQ